MPRLTGDIPYRLRGGGQPTQGCNRKSNLLSNPQSQDHHGGSMLMNGSSDNILTFGSFDLGLGNAWTIMLWVAPANLTPASDQRMFQISDGTNNNKINITIEAGGTLNFEVFSSGGVLLKSRTINSLDDELASGIDGFFLAKNEMTQVVATFDGSTLRCYRNGFFMNPHMNNVADVGGSQTNTIRVLLLGSDIGFTDYWAGYYHQAATWDRALSEDEIRVLWNQGAGSRQNLLIGQDEYEGQDNLQGWYRLGLQPSEIGKDYSPRGLNLAPFVPSTQYAKFAPEGSFFQTRGTESISNTSLPLQDVGNTHAIMAWANPSSLPGEGITDDVVRFTAANPSNNQLAIGLTTSGGQSFWVYEVSDSFGGTNTIVGTTPVVTGVWYQILATKNGTASIRFFVNGVEDIPPIVAGVVSSGNIARDTYVGRDGRGINSSFDGNIGAVALWDTAFSSEGAISIFNSGWRDLDLSVTHPCYAEAVHLQHWWLFGQGSTASTVGDDLVTDMVSTGYALNVYSTDADEQNYILAVLPNNPNGACVDFDSVSGLGNPVAVPVGIGNQFSISLWVYPRNIATDDQVILYIGPASPTTADIISITHSGDLTDNPLSVQVNSDTGTILKLNRYPDLLKEEIWQNLILVVDGTTFDKISLYHNGQLVSGVTDTSNSGSVGTSFRFIDLGGSPNVTSGLLFDGRISHVGIWDTLLSLDEVTTIFGMGHTLDFRYNNEDYQSGENLQHYYKLGEDTFTIGRDFMDNQRGDALIPLTLETGAVSVYVNAPGFSPSEFPISSRSVELIATQGEELEQASTVNFGIPGVGGAFTISVWAKRLDVDFSAQGLVNFGRGPSFNQNFFNMIHDSASGILSCQLFADATSGQKIYRSSLPVPPLFQWFMYTLTFDGGNLVDSLKLYIDDTWDSTPDRVIDNDISGYTNIAMSGKIGDGAEHYIYSVAVWNSDLSDLEVGAIYNGGNAGFFDLLTDQGNYTSSSNLLSWWLTGREPSPDIGKDFGPQGNDLTQVNVDNTNRIVDIPSP